MLVHTLKQFYRRFDAERTLLLATLRTSHPYCDCSSETTMLLIRLMFTYFLRDVDGQEQGVLLELKGRAELGRMCALFDEYEWRLDDQKGTHYLHPDVLGYVFEQQVNQKQMGAYYTQRDVTDYIAERTILPYLFSEAERIHPSLFVADQAIWQLLRTQPERYVHPTLCSASYLPTETEREYSIRQERHRVLIRMMYQGKICTVDEMVTNNLNIRRFVLDYIETCDNPSLLLTHYVILERMTVLDPTCGTGAFLLTAMSLLRELYTACFERMRQFVEGLDESCDTSDEKCFVVFRDLLVGSTPRFIYESLIRNNLYGIDIMPEAVEVCGMRLTLAVVACGDRGISVETASLRPVGGSIKGEDAMKRSLQWNVRQGNALVDETWVKSFPEHSNGFDVIIGNPPYVEYNKVVGGNGTYGNLYAEIVERSLMHGRIESSYVGLIVPLSICGGERFAALRDTIVVNTSALWLANFDIFPCRLFEGAYQRLTILLGKQGKRRQADRHKTYVTRIQRWYTSERSSLIERITYTQTWYGHKKGVFPKLASVRQEDILQKMAILTSGNTVKALVSEIKTEHAVYYQEAVNSWVKTTRRIPYYKKNGVVTKPPHGRLLYFDDDRTAHIVCALMNSTLFYLWFATYSDGFHLSHTLVQSFPIHSALCSNDQLLRLAKHLEETIQSHAVYSTRNTRTGDSIAIEEYRMVCSKAMLDEIDYVLAKLYSFTDEEVDFIIHYDSKYRIGKTTV